MGIPYDRPSVLNKEQCLDIADKMFGKTLITKQTGAEGKPVTALLLCEKFEIKSERYFAILMDRESNGPLLIGSAIGRTSVEDLAEAAPTPLIKAVAYHHLPPPTTRYDWHAVVPSID